jgi:hypothetical protein
MTIPPFPIVSTPVAKNAFVTSSWNVFSMAQLTVNDFCRINPTQAPTKPPVNTPAPTNTPTRSPTEFPLFEGVDLFIYLDRSGSLKSHASLCKPSLGNLPIANSQACWELLLRFAERIVAKALAIHAPLPSSPAFGWNGDRTKVRQGVRVWVYGFGCQDGVPVMNPIAEKVRFLSDFQTAMTAARDIVPAGNACPTSALDRSLGMMMANELEWRYKAGIMLTDSKFKWLLK